LKEIHILNAGRYGYDFISGEFLPAGKDEYWRRDEQQVKLNGKKALDGSAGGTSPWRALTSGEIELLLKNGNFCTDWNNFFVSDPFDASLIRNASFYGLIRLGVLRDVLLKHHDFCVPAGIRSSTIISCDIGDDMAIQDCSYISHYIIGDCCILSRIDEMQATNHAKFGNGIIKDGESEDVRVWIDVMNESGGRSILPFQDMLPADAFLWAGFRDDAALAERLKKITQESCGGERGSYGTVGSFSVIKSCNIIKDAAIGSCAYIKGAHKLKNITILSSEEEPSQIGEGVEMVNGIVGYGCHVFYGSKAVRFVLGRNSNLKYGARLIHSVLGDNSTVSCCEILNNLIFPIHEQHHNNSFLIAGLVQGMSNIAAGATLGSNHNSRANDGEIRAGRGFWPGLAVTIKHSSRFASFVLVTKGDYPQELNITLPFSMVSNNILVDRLEVMPAYYWMYNLYALERNSRKAAGRDRRVIKAQHIEMDYLAPDTAEEIISAIEQLRFWMAGSARGDEVFAPGLERNDRGTVVLKPEESLAAYKEMLLYYAVKTLAAFLYTAPDLSFAGFRALLESSGGEWEAGYQADHRIRRWENMGGQIVPAFRLDILRKQIGGGTVAGWKEIHSVYDKWHEQYPLDKARHAYSSLQYLHGLAGGVFDAREFKHDLDAALKIKKYITNKVYETRAKDYSDPFRVITFRNRDEMERVAGNPENNAVIKSVKEDEQRFFLVAEQLSRRL
jgi:hypothetical protein